MLSRTITAAVALAAAAAVSTAVYRYRCLHRVLARERAAHRLMAGCLHRDMAAFQTRIGAALARQQAERVLLGEADLVLNEALAAHGTDPHEPYDPYQEGGPV